jgi:hypothetical protein
MLEKAIEINEKLLDLFRKKTRPSQIFLNEISKFHAKAKHYKPNLYLELDNGNISSVHGNEDIIVIVIQKEEAPQDEKDEWDHMIDSGVNSGQLINIIYCV